MTGQVGPVVSFYTPAGGKRGAFCAKSPRKVKNARANRNSSAQSGFLPRRNTGSPRKADFRRANRISPAQGGICPRRTGGRPRKAENRRARRFFAAQSGFWSCQPGKRPRRLPESRRKSKTSRRRWADLRRELFPVVRRGGKTGRPGAGGAAESSPR